MNFDNKENGRNKAFHTNPSINIMKRNMENMIVMPITKLMEIITSIQACLLSRMNFDNMKNGGNKAFLANPIINIMYRNMENMIVMPITKLMETITSIQACLLS